MRSHGRRRSRWRRKPSISYQCRGNASLGGSLACARVAPKPCVALGRSLGSLGCARGESIATCDKYCNHDKGKLPEKPRTIKPILEAAAITVCLAVFGTATSLAIRYHVHRKKNALREPFFRGLVEHSKTGNFYILLGLVEDLVDKYKTIAPLE